MKPGEYQASLRGDSWKLDLIQAINEALEYSIIREDFITNMENGLWIAPVSAKKSS